MFKKAVTFLIVILTLVSFPNFDFKIKAEPSAEYKDLTNYNADELRRCINKDIEDFYELTYEFYPWSIDGRTLNWERFAKDKVNGMLLGDSIVYGPGFEKSETFAGAPGSVTVPYSGYGVDGIAVVDKTFLWYTVGWTGRRLANSPYLVSYNDYDLLNHEFKEGCRHLTTVESNRNSSFTGITEIPYTKSGTLEEAIQAGVDWYWAGVRGSQVDFRTLSPPDGNGSMKSNANRLVHVAGDKPEGGWNKYLYIKTPPTYYSWGEGIRYSKDPDPKIGEYYEIPIPIAPFSLLEDDFAASIESLYVNQRIGDTVQIGIKVDSTFFIDTQPYYEWNIVSESDGSPIDVTYEGNARSKIGWLKIDSYGENILYANFKLPKGRVKIYFTVNSDHKYKENNLTNNTIEIIVPDGEPLDGDISVEEGFVLPYYALSRDFKIDLDNVGDEPIKIEAQLSKPSNSLEWVGKPSGGYIVDNDNDNIFKNFKVEQNPTIPKGDSSEDDKTYFTRSPEIHFQIDRANLGDDPYGGKFYSGPTPTSITEKGKITGSGEVKRNYYIYDASYSGEDEDRPKIEVTARNDFNKVDYGVDVEVQIYNGKQTLDKKMIYTDSLSDKTGFKTDIRWEGTPYTFNVFRQMCRIDEEGQIIPASWINVNGQYTRTFIGQSSGSITWSVVNSMASNYEDERTAARNAVKESKKGSKYYQDAVFATDKELQKYDYPIKSGYYFNPKATCKCVIETKQYKNVEGPTVEHAEIIEKAKKSFRFDSTMIYTVTGGSNKYELKNIGEGNEQRLLEITSSAPGDTVVSSRRLTTGRSNSETSDVLLREVLEGYAESDSLNSFTEYGYREFVKSQSIYEIVEKTEIIFEIRPINPDTMIYTHYQMRDGGYTMWASVKGFMLEGESFSTRPIDMSSIATLDMIPITVRGSIYDDQY